MPMSFSFENLSVGNQGSTVMNIGEKSLLWPSGKNMTRMMTHVASRADRLASTRINRFSCEDDTVSRKVARLAAAGAGEGQPILEQYVFYHVRLWFCQKPILQHIMSRFLPALQF
jgi:hypothetical protein